MSVQTTVDETTAVERWREALDDFEARLDRFDAVLERDADPEIGSDWPSAGTRTVDLPAELAERARQLLARADELHTQLSAARDGLRRPNAVNRRRSSTGRASYHADL